MLRIIFEKRRKENENSFSLFIFLLIRDFFFDKKKCCGIVKTLIIFEKFVFTKLLS